MTGQTRFLLRTPLFGLLAVALFLLHVPGSQAGTGGGSPGKVVVLTIDGAIGPVTSEYVLEGLDQAKKEGAQLVVLKMDTPGGLVETTRKIIKGMLASPVPVAVYVSPRGARAASAGTYILYASHIAAMAPATTLGSATPVQMGGFPGMPDKPETTPDKDETGSSGKPDEAAEPASGEGQTAMERKIVNDAAAYIRGLAELRGRNADWAEKAVREAVDLTANEALEQNVADLIAPDLESLLQAIDGRSVEIEKGKEKVTLHTAGADVEYLEPGWRTRFLSVITDPNMVYILILLAFYGLLWEFISPGAVVPGVIGGIALVLALYSLHILPVNYAGLALMLLGIMFMVAEALTPSFGMLGIGGIIAFTVGSVILFDEKGYSISLSMIIGNAILSAVFFIWVIGMVFRIRRKPSISGKQTLVGAVAEATIDFEQEGYVEVVGESWKAVSDLPVHKGQKLRVKSVDGLLLKVEPND